ncbi:hypothetical protein BDP27DRAFT_863722 [Rhodocollybia butyracea]|uniref:Uncharacterized protein n=1 Tax=Rhodocollybia butyracea TaxID=206335 RepID=A0A9P5PRK0_9AGAR|nr:hypothetical protein BDP27DRAFT_863722 [Rhodocollybia butyracea]
MQYTQALIEYMRFPVVSLFRNRLQRFNSRLIISLCQVLYLSIWLLRNLRVLFLVVPNVEPNVWQSQALAHPHGCSLGCAWYLVSRSWAGILTTTCHKANILFAGVGYPVLP